MKEGYRSNENLPLLDLEKIYVAGNRGPCGGVNMAIAAAGEVLDIVDSREKVYSNWDIVNNNPVVNELSRRGLVSVKNDWDRVPFGSIVFFSAHGVPPKFWEIAKAKNFLVVDTTCQLVTRVHNLAKRAERDGKHVVYIGVLNHPETTGVMGELSEGNVSLVTKKDEVKLLELPESKPVVVYSQTTLTPRDVYDIELALINKYPNIEIPNRFDICYATLNRQDAVRELLGKVQALIVVGSSHSHNSTELRNAGFTFGVPSYLVDSEGYLQLDNFCNIKTVGVTSGASVPEKYLKSVIDFLCRNSKVTPQVIYDEPIKDEGDLTFKLPTSDIEKLKERFKNR